MAGPNYFVAIQIKNPQIHDVVKEIQTHVVNQQRNLNSAVEDERKLHITLMVTFLDSKALPLNRIKRAMDDCVAEARAQSLLPLSLKVNGMGSFPGDAVVFARISQGSDKLHSMAEIVRSSFAANGMPPADNRPFQPHMTVFNIRRNSPLWKQGIQRIDPLLYERYMNSFMGDEAVTTLQLCAMMEPKDAHGYYKKVYEVQLLE